MSGQEAGQLADRVALGQGDASEKQLLAVRRGSFSAAHKLYQALQARALELPQPTRSREMGPER